MKYFLDCEFLEDFTHPWIGKSRHYIDLISIGIVAEDGREYSAVSNEFDIDHVWNKYHIKTLNVSTGEITKEYWLRENVLKPIFYEMASRDWSSVERQIMTLDAWRNDQIWSNDLNQFKKHIRDFGKSNKQIAEEINYFVMKGVVQNAPHPFESPEFYGYYSDYDWVLFCSLYGRMLDLPTGFPMYCRDLKQTLEEKNAVLKKTYSNAYEFNAVTTDYGTGRPGYHRYQDHNDYPKKTNEHNALADAWWNKQLHDFLQTV